MRSAGRCSSSSATRSSPSGTRRRRERARSRGAARRGPGSLSLRRSPRRRRGLTDVRPRRSLALSIGRAAGVRQPPDQLRRGRDPNAGALSSCPFLFLLLRLFEKERYCAPFRHSPPSGRCATPASGRRPRHGGRPVSTLTRATAARDGVAQEKLDASADRWTAKGYPQIAIRVGCVCVCLVRHACPVYNATGRQWAAVVKTVCV